MAFMPSLYFNPSLKICIYCTKNVQECYKMDYNLPHRIKNERDLQIYENYLKQDSIDCLQKEPLQDSQERNSAFIATESLMQSKPAEMQYRIMPDTAFFYNYLKKHKGKLIKAESLIGNRLESRIGILLEIGNDYIVLKLPRSNCTLAIKTVTIKYVTIVHDNDITKTYN